MINSEPSQRDCPGASSPIKKRPATAITAWARCMRANAITFPRRSPTALIGIYSPSEKSSGCFIRKRNPRLTSQSFARPS